MFMTALLRLYDVRSRSEESRGAGRRTEEEEEGGPGLSLCDSVYLPGITDMHFQTSLLPG